MDKETILAMKPGRELDSLVAEKVMGWKTAIMNGFETYVMMGVPKPWVSEWNPSTDIFASLEVVKNHYGDVCIQKSFDHDEWYAAFYRPYKTPVTSGWCKSAPEAICKASLLSLLEGIEN